MNKIKVVYIAVTFVVPFILITLLNVAFNADRSIYIDMLMGFLFIIVSNLCLKPFKNWVLTHNKEDEVWDWAFDSQSQKRGILYVLFLIASIVVAILLQD